MNNFRSTEVDLLIIPTDIGKISHVTWIVYNFFGGISSLGEQGIRIQRFQQPKPFEIAAFTPGRPSVQQELFGELFKQDLFRAPNLAGGEDEGATCQCTPKCAAEFGLPHAFFVSWWGDCWGKAQSPP